MKHRAGTRGAAMAASDDVAALSLLIDAHYANFEAKRGQGAKPSAEDLAAVPEWLDAHLRKRKAEKEAAPPQVLTIRIFK